MPGSKVNHTVLVAEDIDDIRLIVKLTLEEMGYRVAEAVDGMQAIEMAMQEHPSIILMDLNLPLMSGIDAARKIRKQAELKNTPIVAYSAYDESKWRDKALKAGCNEFITKPVDFNQLEDLIKRLLSSP
jgi:two-component system, cell cycle response regulator DivK